MADEENDDDSSTVNRPSAFGLSKDNMEMMTATASVKTSESTSTETEDNFDATNKYLQTSHPVSIKAPGDDSLEIELDVNIDDFENADADDTVIICPHCTNVNTPASVLMESLDVVPELQNEDVCKECGFPLGG